MSDKKLLIKLASDVEGLKQGLKKASSEVDRFSSQIKSIGVGIGAAFSVQAVANFAFEVSKLAGEAQGVREAFSKLPNNIDLMNRLKIATGNTVTELDLMKRSVMAANFGISLKALPQLLEFATIRAKQTGQSIDYLVDSIVTGIGRKSKLILDNLGISAVQLTEALGGASTAASSIEQVADAVGKIASENLKQMGSLSENASTKVERLSASWGNLKVAIGEAANGTGIFGKTVDGLTATLDLFASRNLDFWEKLVAVSSPGGAAAAIVKHYAEELRKSTEEQRVNTQVVKEADRAIATFGNNLEAIKEAYKQNIHFQKIMDEITRRAVDDEKKKAAQIENIRNLTDQLNELQEKKLDLTGKDLVNANKEIQLLEIKIKKLNELGVAQQKVTRGAGTVVLGSGPIPNSDPHGLGSMFSNIELPTSEVEEAERAWQGYNAELERTAQRQQMVSDAVQQIGFAIGENFALAATGAQTFADAISNMGRIVTQELFRIAAAQLATQMLAKYGLIGLGLAAAGIGAVSGLFASIGKRTVSSNESAGSFQRPSQLMNLRGEFILKGSNLVAVMANENRRTGRSKP